MVQSSIENRKILVSRYVPDIPLRTRYGRIIDDHPPFLVSIDQFPYTPSYSPISSTKIIVATIAIGLIIFGATDIIHHLDSDLAGLIAFHLPDVASNHQHIHTIASDILTHDHLTYMIRQLTDLIQKRGVDKIREHIPELSRRFKVPADQITLIINLATAVQP